MSNYIKVDVMCKCGMFLKTVVSDIDGRSTSYSTMKCPSCGKDVSIQVRGGKAHTSYK